MNQANALLARLKAEGRSKVGSLEELAHLVLSSADNLEAFSKGEYHRFAATTGLPEKLLNAVMRSHAFRSMVFEELHYRIFNPSALTEVYEAILQQLKSEDISPGSKRSFLEWMIRQMGLEKPRKLSVKQESEIVVRVEKTEPVQVLEVLGVPVGEDASSADAGRALPAGADTPGEDIGAYLEAERDLAE